MTIFVALIMVAALAAVVAAPFLRAPTRSVMAPTPDADAERLEREKSVALTAIKEAELDHAMGKLSDDDYASLRAIYEQRALGAMAGLDRLSTPSGRPRAASPAVPSTAITTPGALSGDGRRPAAFCAACGNPFGGADRFCAACGTARGEISVRA